MKYHHTLSQCVHILLKLNGLVSKNNNYLASDYVSVKECLRSISKNQKINFKQTKITLSRLSSKCLPIIYRTVSGDFAVLAKISDSHALIQCPTQHSPSVVTIKELRDVWSNDVIVVADNKLNFDITWFIPEFIRYRRELAEVLLLSFVMQILALILPLFFQVIMDKVLVHKVLSTLDVLIVVLVIVGTFEVVLKGLREYLFIHSTNRIDIRLGLRLFKHLLALPLGYFKSRQVGTIVMRVKELSTIRALLTGAALTLLVDVSFVFVFLGVMYYLSPFLTVIILGILPLYILLAWSTAKPLEKRIEHQFQCGAKNTAFLTESIHGCETVKSLAIEPIFQRKWENQTEEVVKTTFSTQSLQAGINQAVNLLQKLSGVFVIWLGAHMVITLEMTIGQLVAFNMMVSHINQPMAKLVELWQQFIQTRVAIDKLGDVLNLPTEEHVGQSQLRLKGNITFHQVSFKYQPQLPYVLNRVSLTIHSGENIAFVGPSGSGKSSLIHLIQKLYLAESGHIHIDGKPISQLSGQQLRQQIGVVLQDNYLFNRTVRDNIAIKHPTSPLSEVVKVAKLAGAHEFILQLEKGYDTILVEGGCSLSGGQKQRIAIARALLGDPKLLIFDEATSALDDETQHSVLSNMKLITANRTVITVAHRLSTIKHCDRIVVLDKGEVVEQGSHTSLVALNGRYAKLWTLQKNNQQEGSQ